MFSSAQEVSCGEVVKHFVNTSIFVAYKIVHSVIS